MANSTRKRKPRNHQSAKPHPDYPLTAHPSGRWCKKVRGKIHYFGPLNDPDAALAKWLREKDELLAGRVPRSPVPDGLTLKQLANSFLKHKRTLVTAGELSPRTLADNYRTCAAMIDHFGQARLLDDFRQSDFAAYRVALSKRLGPVALGNEIQRVRSVFKFALDSEMIDKPIRFGPGFARPTKKVLRLQRAKKGPKLFSAEEIRKLLDVASANVKAMILLACNAGLGNADVACLPITAVDLETGWCNFPRVKTGIPRRFHLWPETVEALQQSLASRPVPKDLSAQGLVFVTKYGGAWAKSIFEQRAEFGADEGQQGPQGKKHKINVDSAVAKEFVKLFAAANLQRGGRGFYCLRHVFATVAGESKDQVATNFVMGHVDDTMSAVYREAISDERLKAVTDHVHTWLFPVAKHEPTAIAVAPTAAVCEEE